MNIIEPIQMTDAILNSSNVTEADHAAWNSGTTYAIGDRVIKLSTHKIYQATAISTNKDPELAVNSSFWVTVSATNRWKAFDGKIGDQVTRATPIQYILEPGQAADGIAIFGLDATSVSISITDSIDGLVYNENFFLFDNAEVIDWFTYFYEPIVQKTELIVTGLPLYTTGVVTILVGAPVTAKVGEIVMGRNYFIGDTKNGTGLGIRDYSTKQDDPFGNVEIVERAFTQTVGFEVAFPASSARRIFKLLARNRARPAVYHDGEASEPYGTLIYGFYGGSGAGLEIDLISEAVAYARIEIEGLV